MFSEEELRDISVLEKGDDYVEVICGCTSLHHGDAGATLRVFVSGELKISCECYRGCPEDKLTPAAFEKHAGKETCGRWKNNIWIFVDGYKVPLIKTALLKYHKKFSKHAKRSQKICHRDEFVICSECKKRRRFHRRSEEELRSYHDAMINVHWKCSDIPFGKFSCDDAEERASRRVYKGCLRSLACGGCTSCVCFGCEVCCLSNCSCQTCIDFTKKTEA